MNMYNIIFEKISQESFPMGEEWCRSDKIGKCRKFKFWDKVSLVCHNVKLCNKIWYTSVIATSLTSYCRSNLNIDCKVLQCGIEILKDWNKFVGKEKYFVWKRAWIEGGEGNSNFFCLKSSISWILLIMWCYYLLFLK